MHNTYSTWEGLFVDIIDDSGKKITICNIYRPPRNNNNHVSIDSFLLDFSPVVKSLSKISKNVALAGDFNIDLLKLIPIVNIIKNFMTHCQILISYL